MRPPGSLPGPGWGGPKPGRVPPWRPGYLGTCFNALCNTISSCLYVLCCCCLLQDCFGDPAGPPAPFTKPGPAGPPPPGPYGPPGPFGPPRGPPGPPPPPPPYY